MCSSDLAAPSVRTAATTAMDTRTPRRRGATARASPAAALDMAGTVTAWVADATGDARHGAERAVVPRVMGPTSSRVVRGGAWNHPGVALRTAWRAAVPAGARERSLGFRCARDAW